MDVNHDPHAQETPPSTPFDDGFTPSTTKGYTSADPTRKIHTENFFTPLYTEPRVTDHANANTKQQSPAPTRTSLEATRDAKLAADAAAAAAEAKASVAAAAAEMEYVEEMEAEAAASDAAKLIARLA
jgi:hypothetical protein